MMCFLVRWYFIDEDQTSVTESGGHGGVTWRRLNTLKHYHVNDGAAFVLVPKHTNFYNLTIMSDKSDKSLQSHKSSPGLSRGASPFVRGDADAEHGIKSWHLVRPHDSPDPPSRDGTTKRSSKLVTEIYLTRLLTTKSTLKKYIDDMFQTILSPTFHNYAFPQAIKYLFDFLDDQALHYEIQDPEVVHTWKSNSLPLRFWVNLIKNPNFVFNIHKVSLWLITWLTGFSIYDELRTNTLFRWLIDWLSAWLTTRSFDRSIDWLIIRLVFR